MCGTAKGHLETSSPPRCCGWVLTGSGSLPYSCQLSQCPNPRMDTPKPRGTGKPALNASTMCWGNMPRAGRCDSPGAMLSLAEGAQTRWLCLEKPRLDGKQFWTQQHPMGTRQKHPSAPRGAWGGDTQHRDVPQPRYLQKH